MLYESFWMLLTFIECHHNPTIANIRSYFNNNTRFFTYLMFDILNVNRRSVFYSTLNIHNSYTFDINFKKGKCCLFTVYVNIMCFKLCEKNILVI